MKFMYFSRRNHEKGTKTRLHFHNYYELIYCVSGSGNIEYNPNPVEAGEDFSRTIYPDQTLETNYTIPFKNGTAIIFEPNVIHFEDYKDSDTDLVAIGFQVDSNEKIINKFSRNEDQTLFVKSMVHSIEKEFKNKDYNYISNIESYINIINTYIIRNNENKDQMQSQSFDIEYAINYLDEYFKTDINFEDFSSMIGYCSDYFRILFKNKTGFSPKQYVINKRMEYASNLINNTNLPLKTIAEECGYTDYFQFSTYFKKYYGHSPKRTNKELI